MVGRREIGLLFSNKDGSSFLNIGITFAMFSLSGNTPEYKTWFINSVNDFKITGSITLSNFVVHICFCCGKVVYSFPHSFFVRGHRLLLPPWSSLGFSVWFRCQYIYLDRYIKICWTYNYLVF